MYIGGSSKQKAKSTTAAAPATQTPQIGCIFNHSHAQQGKQQQQQASKQQQQPTRTLP
jgi:hypothetical protein